MSRIIELQIIFQKPVDEKDVDPDEFNEKVFATQGQTEVYKYIKTSNNTFVENFLEILSVNIPTGIPGMKRVVRVAVLRVMNRLKDEKAWDRDWSMFYVIAKFETVSSDGTETFFRTIIPRTEINVQLRSLRRRNVQHRESGSEPHRRIRRKKV